MTPLRRDSLAERLAKAALSGGAIGFCSTALALSVFLGATDSAGLTRPGADRVSYLAFATIFNASTGALAFPAIYAIFARARSIRAFVFRAAIGYAVGACMEWTLGFVLLASHRHVPDSLGFTGCILGALLGALAGRLAAGPAPLSGYRRTE